MKLSRNLGCSVSAAIAVVLANSAYATNGMNLEGYGPVATAMGGASMAYDNGTAAVMNNPATLGLMSDGARLDVALGMLGPDVESTVTTSQGNMSASSDSNAFYMPAMGYARKHGMWTYGLGVFGQGGMGTEFGGTTWMSNPGQQATSPGLVNRSEVSVGRLVVPLVFQPASAWRVGGSLDFVWAGMDLQMAMSQTQFLNLTTPGKQNIGTASGTLAQGFGQAFQGGAITKLHYAHFDFSDDSKFTGKAMGYGAAGKLGVTFQPISTLTLGATYHTKTSLSDLETSDAKMSMSIKADPSMLAGNAATSQIDMVVPLTGKMTVVDFQWPDTFGLGAAWKATDKVMLVGDVKRINWSGVMKNFTMKFEADNVATNGLFAGKVLDATLYQDWEDQTVIELGAAFQVKEGVTLRAGFNHASNPIPDKYLNALFPAIVEDHVTFGAGFHEKASSIDLSVTKALEVEATNPGVVGTSAADTIPPVASKHSQLSWQLMYSYRF